MVLKVPVEASEWSMLLTLVLQEQWTLLNSELLQVPETYQLELKTEKKI